MEVLEQQILQPYEKIYPQITRKQKTVFASKNREFQGKFVSPVKHRMSCSFQDLDKFSECFHTKKIFEALCQFFIAKKKKFLNEY